MHYLNLKKLQSFLIIFIIVAFCTSLIFPSRQISAQTVLNLPIPGMMVKSTSAFSPAIVKDIKIFPDNPLRFDFIVDTGDSGLNIETGRDLSLQKENWDSEKGDSEEQISFREIFYFKEKESEKCGLGLC